ncbi:PIR Superfamily Protein, partial [Plasmodium ovale curtisi]
MAEREYDMVKNSEEITTPREVNYEEDILDDKEIHFLDEICFSEKKAISCNSLLNDNISSKIQNPHITCEKFKYLYHWLIDLLEEKLNNIESNHLENMKIFFDLYKAKNETYRKITEPVLTNKVEYCLPYKRECNIKYGEGIINCCVGCSDFYKVPKQFKCLYENGLATYKDDKDDLQYKKLIELPGYDSVIKEYRRGQFRRITTTSFLVPLFGLLFLLISSNK